MFDDDCSCSAPPDQERVFESLQCNIGMSLEVDLGIPYLYAVPAAMSRFDDRKSVNNYV